MKPLKIPTIPNSPLVDRHAAQSVGLMQLRRHKHIDFIENALFDVGLAVYDENYQNSQAMSLTFQQHMNEVLILLKRKFQQGSMMVEVGCGKGDFLGMAEQDGHFRVAGYDASYEGDNPSIHKRYLSDNDQLDADLVVLRHVLEHIPQPHKFLRMLQACCGNAAIYVEVPCMDWILDTQSFFDITYEHVNYFNRNSLSHLFEGADIEIDSCFGGQYLYGISKLSALADDFSKKYDAQDMEDLDFDLLFPSLKEKVGLIDQLASKCLGRVYLWGAATKGCMFLIHWQRCGQFWNKIGFAVDANLQKCGKFLPGSLVEICQKEVFFSCATSDDLLIIANPNYFEEIATEVHCHPHLSKMKIISL